MSKTVQYSEMKDSGIKWIGNIPAEWHIVKISFLYDITLGKMLQPMKKAETDTYEKYLCAANVGKNMLKTADIKEMWFNEIEKENLLLKKGDLLVVEGGDVGSSDIIYEDIGSVYFQNSLHRVRGLNGNSNGFLRYFLMAAKSSGYINLICNKATIPHFTKEKLSNMDMVAPDIVQQQAIASFLDNQCTQIDAIIAGARASIEEYKEWRSAVIFECVTNGLNENTEKKDTGIEYIGKLPSHWTVRKTGDISEKLTDYVASGSFASLRENVQYLDNLDYARLIRTVDLSESTNRNPVYISKESYDFLSNSNLFGGELILSNIGSVGSVYQYKPMYAYASLAPNAIMLTMKGNNRFYYYWFSNPRVKESLRLLGGNAVQCKFNKTQLRQYMIPQPPLEEQNAMAEYLDEKCEEIDALIAEKESLIYELENYKKSLIFETVTGKRKVV